MFLFIYLSLINALTLRCTSAFIGMNVYLQHVFRFDLNFYCKIFIFKRNDIMSLSSMKISIKNEVLMNEHVAVSRSLTSGLLWRKVSEMPVSGYYFDDAVGFE